VCGTCGFGQTCSDAGICIECVADCEGRACGGDGCGGSCGACVEGLVCYETTGQCLDENEIPDGDIVESDVEEHEGPCPPGQVFKWGTCVNGEEEQEISEDDSGCSVTQRHSAAPTPFALLLAALLLLVNLRRRCSAGHDPRTEPTHETR